MLRPPAFRKPNVVDLAVSMSELVAAIAIQAKLKPTRCVTDNIHAPFMIKI